MRYQRIRIEGAAYFFTVVTHDKRPILSDPHVVELLHAATEKVRARHPFTIEAEVVLPDHLHAIGQLPDGDANFATRWRLIKEYFTRAYVKEHVVPQRSDVSRWRGEQTVWQRRYWEHLIRDEEDFAAHLDYIHLNPVRHGFVEAAKDWPYSTFCCWVDRGIYEPSWGSGELPAQPSWASQVE